jgi:uncharacterized protein YuzE
MLKTSYDEESDILYINFSCTRNSVGEENIAGFVVFKDFNTSEVTGLTIFDFMKRYENGTLYENQMLALPISIDYESEIMPFL